MSENSPRSENIQDFNDLLMLASAAAPLRGLNFLDFLYTNSVPLYYGGGGDGYGEAGDSVASILARSLYDRRPVKQVITEEAQRDIIDKKFTATMVDELKINDACGIWQEEFEDGEDIKILPCNHAFKADAIIKWLREEKAECPICRFSLQSKEVIDHHSPDHYAVHPPYEAHEHDREDQHADAQESDGDNDIVRVNNIASRLAQSVAGNVNPNFHREHHQQHHRSISVPMNQLLQSMRLMSSYSRSREHVRAAVPSTGGAAAPVSQSSYANAGREVRAEAMQYGGLRNNNSIAAAAAAAPANVYINNYNNYNYIHVDESHQDIVSNQEQVDIEEAIRRSLV